MLIRTAVSVNKQFYERFAAGSVWYYLLLLYCKLLYSLFGRSINRNPSLLETECQTAPPLVLSFTKSLM